DMAKKSNFLKDFDYKQFFINHGEQVGIGVAAVLTILFIVLGTVMAVGSGSPQDNAKPIEQETDRVKKELNTRKPPSDYDKVAPEVMAALKQKQAQLNEGRVPQDF